MGNAECAGNEDKKTLDGTPQLKILKIEMMALFLNENPITRRDISNMRVFYGEEMKDYIKFEKFKAFLQNITVGTVRAVIDKFDTQDFGNQLKKWDSENE